MSGIYEINFLDPGKVLVFVDGRFDRESQLNYIQKDIGLINRTFGNLNFVVDILLDLTSDEIQAKIFQTIDPNLADYSCLVCFFGTGGDLECFTDREGKIIVINEIVDLLTRTNCLSSKPKLFFIDACNGSSKTKLVPNDFFQLNNSRADTLISYASTSDYKKNINKEGSLFIQTLCKNISLNIKCDILDVLSNVNSHLTKNPALIARFDSTLQKKLFFHKDLKHFFKCAKILPTKHSEILCLELINQDLIASGNFDETIIIWDLKSFKCNQTIKNSTKTRIKCLKLIDDETIVSGSFDNSIKIWKWKEKQCVHILHGHKEWVFCLEMISKNLLASGSGDKKINIWDLDKKKCIRTFDGHRDYVYCLQLIDQETLASGSADKTIKIWNLVANVCIETLNGHDDRILCLQAIDQNLLASGSADRSIKIWNWKDSSCVFTLNGHVDFVYCLKMVDKDCLASGSGDKTIKIWNLRYFKCIQTLFGHSDFVLCLELKDPNTLVSGDKNGEIRIWKRDSF